jgi:hypothetical protein
VDRGQFGLFSRRGEPEIVGEAWHTAGLADRHQEDENCWIPRGDER